MLTTKIGDIVKNGEPAIKDIEKLIITRLLEQANSGGGKSYALRKLIEGCAGKVPIFILDSEGEFSTLREKFDFILFGDKEQGADLQLTIKIAKELPRRLMALKVSAILDMSELKKHERILFVKLFLDSMLSLSKKYWTPVIVIIDEADQYCPQKAKCESAQSVIDLMCRGRKRGQCGWLATQRLSKLHKDAAAECNNKLIGRASLDVDMKRAAEGLGFTVKEDIVSMRYLEPGEFFMFGPAFEKGVNLIKIGQVLTTHPEPGMGRRLIAETPPPAKIRAMLDKLHDIASKDEYKVQQERNLKEEVTQLKAQLKAAEMKAERAEKAAKMGGQKIVREGPPWHKIEMELKRIEMAVGRIRKFYGVSFASNMMGEKIKGRKAELVILDETPVVDNSPREVVDNNGLPAGAVRMLQAAAKFNRPVSKQQVATFAGMSVKSGTFGTYLGLLKRNCYVVVLGKNLEVTAKGIKEVGDVGSLSTKPEDLLNLWVTKFPDRARRMMRIIFDRYPESIQKEDLGNEAGIVPTSGTFGTYFGMLKRNGLITVAGREVKAGKELFPQ